MTNKKKFFISTAIPYVNAKPHMGHALEFVTADVLARFHRMQGDLVYFLSGTDDNALKNVQAAEQAGVPIKEYIAEHAQNFESLLKQLSVSNDDFIKTGSDPRHLSGSQKLWSMCEKDMYKKSYVGLYCVGCEEFKTEKDLVNGECPLHPGKKLEQVEEEKYFFKLRDYQDKLLSLIESGQMKILSEGRKNEMTSFIKGGLEDFSISRSRARAKEWGIPVPHDDSQIMYVWFDALANYINALGYGTDEEKFNAYWQEGETVHIVGKDINRFHSIYWPAMLLSAGVKTPTTIMVHGFITSGGQKMSKSIGNVIDPIEILHEYGVEATRYILTREISTFEDTDLTAESMKEAYNANLANGLGNLASRILKMSESYIEEPQPHTHHAVPHTYVDLLNAYEVQKAADFVWQEIAAMDKHIQETEPFKLYKVDKEKAREIVHGLVSRLFVVASMLEPFLPETAQKIKDLITENRAPSTPLFPRKD